MPIIPLKKRVIKPYKAAYILIDVKYHEIGKSIFHIYMFKTNIFLLRYDGKGEEENNDETKENLFQHDRFILYEIDINQ